MPTSRFTLLVVALAALVAAGSFAVAYRVFDDNGAAPAPAAPSSTTAPPIVAPQVGATTSTSAASVTGPGELKTPTWVVVVASGTSRLDADATAQRLAERGYPAGVLRTDDYPSLTKGLWVAYAGPYPSSAAAQSTVDRLTADGIVGSYPRCVGDKKGCGTQSEKD